LFSRHDIAKNIAHLALISDSNGHNVLYLCHDDVTVSYDKQRHGGNNSV
jgi:hypothetical protein